MVKLRGSTCWIGGPCNGGMQIWCTVLLFLCGFCSEAGGDVTIYFTSDVSVTVTEDWSTKIVPSHKVASSTFLKDGSPSATPPLGQVSRTVSQPSDVATVSKIFATSTAVFTELHVSTLYEDSQSSVRVGTPSQHQQSLPMFKSAKGSTDAFIPGDIWGTSTAAVTEQYITTLYQNPRDTKSVDIPVESETVSSDSFNIPLTRSHSTFKSTLQPSSPLNSQRTNFITEWSDVTETLVSIVLDSSRESLHTHLPESATTILPIRTEIVVPSSIFSSLPDSLQPTPSYKTEIYTKPEGYSVTQPLLEETLMVTSDIVVTELTASSEMTKSFSKFETTRTDRLSSLIYFTESTDLLNSDVETRMLSPKSPKPQSTLPSNTPKESTNPDSPRVESTIMLSSVIYITESTDILQPTLPTTQLLAPFASTILSDASSLQRETIFRTHPSYIFETETIELVESSNVGVTRSYPVDVSNSLSLVDQSIQTSEGPSMINSEPVGDVSTETTSTDMLSSLIYFTESTDLLNSDVETQMLSPKSPKPQSTLLSNTAKESTNPDSPRIERTIMLSSVIYITESTDVLQPTLPTTQLLAPFASTILSDASSLQRETIFQTHPSYIFETETIELVESSNVGVTRSYPVDVSNSLSLVDQSIQTSEGPSMINSEPVGDVSTDMLKTVISTITSYMYYTPRLSPTFATPSWPVMSSVPRSTVIVPTIESSVPSVIFGTEIITSEIFATVSSGITAGLAYSSRLVGSEMSTIFEEPTPTPTPLLTSANSVLRSGISLASSSRQRVDSETLWLTSEIVETTMVSRRKKRMASETFGYSTGSPDPSLSTSSVEVTHQVTMSAYETVTVESTLTLPTIILLPVTSRSQSNLRSTFVTNDQSMEAPATTDLVLYSTVVELLTSDVAVTEDLLRSSQRVDSLSFSSPPTFQSIPSSNSLSVQSMVYDTITMSTEVMYSTIVQSPSLPPGPESTVQPDYTTPSPSCCSSTSPPSCTCYSPPPCPPSLPTFCSRSDRGSSIEAPASTLSVDDTVEESYIYETVIITSDITLYPTPNTSGISSSYDITRTISLQSSDLFSTLILESEVVPSQAISIPILSTVLQPETSIASSLYYSSDGNVQGTVSSEVDFVETLIFTTFVWETTDSLYPSYDIVPTTSKSIYTYTPRTPEIPFSSTPLDQTSFPETLFSSVYETRTSDIFTAVMPTMETSHLRTYPVSSRYTDILDTSQGISTISDIYEIITTEVYEYVTTDLYDSRSTEEYQVPTLSLTPSKPSLQTGSTLLVESEEMPSLPSSVVMETSVLPIDTSAVSYEVSSVLFTTPETSVLILITPSMPSDHLTASDGLVTTDSTKLFSKIPASSLDSVTQSFLYSTAVDISTVMISDVITDTTFILETISEYYPTPSTPSFPSTLLQSLPTFTPMLPSYTHTPGIDTSSAMIHTTLPLESSLSDGSTRDLSSVVTEISIVSDSALSSVYTPSDYFTDIFVTSEIVTVYTTDTLPVTMSSIEDYLTVVISSSHTFEPSYSTGPLAETTQVVEPRTSETIPLLTPLESLQISSLPTIMYTTMLDTVFTNTLITSSATTPGYSSSVLTIATTLSSENPEMSISEIYATVSLATTDFASSIVPSTTTIGLLTSSVDIMPSRSFATIRTSFVPTVETSVGSSLFAETLSIVTPTSKVEEIVFTTVSMDGPVLSSFDTYSIPVLSGNYDSVISPSFTTPVLEQATDYVISTMIGPTSPVSERDIVTDEVTPTAVSSSFAAVESSTAVSLMVTDTVTLGSVVLPSDTYTPTLLNPSPSDSLIVESSASLATSSETPPLTSLPTYTTSSLLHTVATPSSVLSDSTFSLAASFPVSEELLSSSVAAQRTTSLIWSTASQMVTPSIPSTLPLVTTTTEPPIEVPEEFQLTMDIKVPTSEDIKAEEFSQTLSNNLAILYIEGESNILRRRRRSNREGDTRSEDKTNQKWIFTRKQQFGEEGEDNIFQTKRRINTKADALSGDPGNQEWIFSRKQQSGESHRTVQQLERKEQYSLMEEPLYDRLSKESSTEMEWMFVSKQMGTTSPAIKDRTTGKVRIKRQADPSDEIEVPILALSRSDDADPETVSVAFYVMENDSLVLATDAAATYNTLTEGEMSAQLGYAVRSMPSPVIPIPTSTPDYPYTIPPAEQTDWLKMTLLLDVAFDETNATFQKQLRNDLEFLYVNGSDGLENNPARKRRDLRRMIGLTRRDLARNIGRTAGIVGRVNPNAGDVILESDLVRERRAADPSSETEVALQSVDRPQANGEDVEVAFYVIDKGLVVPGDTALIPYQQFTLIQLQDVIDYVVVSPGVTLYLTATPTGLAWWWYLLIALIAILLIIVIVLFIYYYCWAKKTAVKSLNKVDRSTSVELGFLRLDREPKAKLVVMETVLDEKPSKRSHVNGSASHEADQERLTEEATQKRKKKRRSKRAQESAREYAQRGYLSGEDDQLFSHVDAHATKPKSKKPTSTTTRIQNNAVYPQAERLPPLKHRSLVAYSETESEISSEQLRMMRKAGVPKSWYTTHIDKDPEELKKDIAKEKKRQKKKEKKLQDQLTAEQMQKEFDRVLGGKDEQEIKNPTARQLQATRTDRWKPKNTRKSEIPESTGIIDESTVRLIRTRPLESAAPPAPNHEDIKKEIEELLKRGPPKPVKGPLSKAPSLSEEEAKELAEKKEKEVRLRRKWAEERKRLNRILDEAFALTSTSLGSSSEQPTGDTPTASNGQSVTGDREFHKDLEESGYLRHRDYYGYDALDDTFLPGMIPGRLTVAPRSIPLYETSFGLDLSGEHLYDSIRRPPIEYEFLPSQMRSDGAAPAYGVSISPVRTQRAPRVAPYPPRDVLSPTDPYRSLNSSMSSSLQPMQITPRNHHPDRTIATGHQRPNRNSDEGSEQDIIRVQEENLSLQRLVAKQQRELDHALALIGQPNSRIGQSEKNESKEGKVGSNGRKQRRVVPVNSTKPLSGPSTMSAWTDDHKVVERTSHTLTSTPKKDNMTKVKPRPSSVVLEHHIEKPGKGSTNEKEKVLHT